MRLGGISWLADKKAEDEKVKKLAQPSQTVLNLAGSLGRNKKEEPKPSTMRIAGHDITKEDDGSSTVTAIVQAIQDYNQEHEEPDEPIEPTPSRSVVPSITPSAIQPTTPTQTASADYPGQGLLPYGQDTRQDRRPTVTTTDVSSVSLGEPTDTLQNLYVSRGIKTPAGEMQTPKVMNAGQTAEMQTPSRDLSGQEFQPVDVSGRIPQPEMDAIGAGPKVEQVSGEGRWKGLYKAIGTPPGMSEAAAATYKPGGWENLNWRPGTEGDAPEDMVGTVYGGIPVDATGNMLFEWDALINFLEARGVDTAGMNMNRDFDKFAGTDRYVLEDAINTYQRSETQENIATWLDENMPSAVGNLYDAFVPETGEMGIGIGNWYWNKSGNAQYSSKFTTEAVDGLQAYAEWAAGPPADITKIDDWKEAAYQLTINNPLVNGVWYLLGKGDMATHMVADTPVITDIPFYDDGLRNENGEVESVLTLGALISPIIESMIYGGDDSLWTDGGEKTKGFEWIQQQWADDAQTIREIMLIEDDDKRRTAMMAFYNGASGTLTETGRAIMGQQDLAEKLKDQAYEAAGLGNDKEAAELWASAMAVENTPATEYVDQYNSVVAEMLLGLTMDPTNLVGPLFKAIGAAPEVAAFLKNFNLMNPTAAKETRIATDYLQGTFDRMGRMQSVADDFDGLMKKFVGDKWTPEIEGNWLSRIANGYASSNMNPLRKIQPLAETHVERMTTTATRTAYTLFQDVENVADARKILTTWLEDPTQLAKGMGDLTSTKFQRYMQETGGEWVFDSRLWANKEAAESYEVLQLLRNRLGEFESLKEGRFNLQHFIAEFDEMMYRSSREAMGLQDFGHIPAGTTRFEIDNKYSLDDTWQVRFFDKDDNILTVRPFENRREAIKYKRNLDKAIRGTTGSAAAKMQAVAAATGDTDLLTKVAQMQRGVLSTMYLHVRPAHWIRNAVAATATLMADGTYSMLSRDEMYDNITYLLGDVFEDRKVREAMKGAAGAGTQGGWTKAPWQWLQNNKIVKGGAEIWAGNTFLGPNGTGLRFGENSFYLTAFEKTLSRTHRRLWKDYVNTKLMPNLVEAVGEERARILANGMMARGPKGWNEVLDFARTYENVTLSAVDMGIPAELLSTPALDEINRLLRNMNTENLADTAKGIRTVLDGEKNVIARQFTGAGGIHPGTTKIRAVDEESAAAIAIDQLKLDADRAGVPLEEVQRVTRRIAETSAATAESNKQTMASLAERVATGGHADIGTLSLWWMDAQRKLDNHYREMVDALGYEATRAGTKAGWENKWLKTQEAYEWLLAETRKLNDEILPGMLDLSPEELAEKLKHVSTEGLLERYNAYDMEELAFFRRQGLNLKGADGQDAYMNAIRAGRDLRDRSFLRLYDMFGQAPTEKNLELVAHATERAQEFGNYVASELATLRRQIEAAGGGADQWSQYYRIRNAYWDQYTDIVVQYNDSVLRYMGDSHNLDWRKVKGTPNLTTAASTQPGEDIRVGLAQTARQQTPVEPVTQAADNVQGRLAEAQRAVDEMEDAAKMGQPVDPAIQDAVYQELEEAKKAVREAPKAAGSRTMVEIEDELRQVRRRLGKVNILSPESDDLRRQLKVLEDEKRGIPRQKSKVVAAKKAASSKPQWSEPDLPGMPGVHQGNYRTAEQVGVVDDIIRMAAEKKTAREIASALHSSRLKDWKLSEVEELVLNTRAHLGIPSSGPGAFMGIKTGEWTPADQKRFDDFVSAVNDGSWKPKNPREKLVQPAPASTPKPARTGKVPPAEDTRAARQAAYDKANTRLEAAKTAGSDPDYIRELERDVDREWLLLQREVNGQVLDPDTQKVVGAVGEVADDIEDAITRSPFTNRVEPTGDVGWWDSWRKTKSTDLDLEDRAADLREGRKLNFLGLEDGETVDKVVYEELVNSYGLKGSRQPITSDIATHQLAKIREIDAGLEQWLSDAVKTLESLPGLTPTEKAALMNAVQGAGGDYATIVEISRRMAQEMGNFAMLDFGHRRGFDTWLGFLAPYHFFLTRSGYNWGKRLFSNPMIARQYYNWKAKNKSKENNIVPEGGYMKEHMRAAEQELHPDWEPGWSDTNRTIDTPMRLRGKIHWGGGYYSADPFDLAVPINIYKFNEFANEPEAGQSIFEKNYNRYNQLPFGLLTGTDFVVNWMMDQFDPMPNGEKRTARFNIGQIVPQVSLMGYAYMKSTGKRPMWMNPANGFLRASQDWDTYNMGKEASLVVTDWVHTEDGFTDREAKFAQQYLWNWTYSGQQDYEGRDIDEWYMIPDDPELRSRVDQLLTVATQNMANSRLFSRAMSYFVGLPFYKLSDNEVERIRQIEEWQALSGETNPYGGKEVQSQYFEEEGAGLPSYFSKSDLVPGQGPGVRDETEPVPGESQMVRDISEAESTAYDEAEADSAKLFGVSYDENGNMVGTPNFEGVTYEEYQKTVGDPLQRKLKTAREMYVDHGVLRKKAGSMRGANPWEREKAVVRQLLAMTPDAPKPKYPGTEGSQWTVETKETLNEYYDAKDAWEELRYNMVKPLLDQYMAYDPVRGQLAGLGGDLVSARLDPQQIQAFYDMKEYLKGWEGHYDDLMFQGIPYRDGEVDLFHEYMRWRKDNSPREIRERNIASKWGTDGVRIANAFFDVTEGLTGDAKKAAKKQYLVANPGVTGWLVYGDSPEAWQEIVDRWGEESFKNFEKAQMALADMPPYPEPGSDKEVFNSWFDLKTATLNETMPEYEEYKMYLMGRSRWYKNPEILAEAGITPEHLAAWGYEGGGYYDFGADYAKAIEIFGPDIFEWERELDNIENYKTWIQKEENKEKKRQVLRYDEWKKAMGSVPEDAVAAAAAMPVQPAAATAAAASLEPGQWNAATQSFVPPEGVQPQAATGGGTGPRSSLFAPSTMEPAGTTGYQLDTEGPQLTAEQWGERSETLQEFNKTDQEIMQNFQNAMAQFGGYGLTEAAWTQYFSLPAGSEARREMKNKNPALKAALLISWAGNEWAQAQQDGFTLDHVMAWAKAPVWVEGSDNNARSSYYKANPDAWLFNAYLNGRPGSESYDNTPENYRRNWGADFKDAQRQFGKDIWDVAVAYRSLPDDKTARSAFYKAHPSYLAFADWWYANIDSGTRGAFQKFSTWRAYRGGYGGGGGYSRYKPENLADSGRPRLPDFRTGVRRFELQGTRGFPANTQLMAQIRAQIQKSTR